RLEGHVGLDAAAQGLEEAACDREIELELGRKLHEQAPELRAQRLDLREEFVEERRRVVQPSLVCYRLRHFHAEAKAGRDAPRPAREGRALVRAIERGVDLERAEDRR